jgi:hypothetical protein
VSLLSFKDKSPLSSYTFHCIITYIPIRTCRECYAISYLIILYALKYLSKQYSERDQFHTTIHCAFTKNLSGSINSFFGILYKISYMYCSLIITTTFINCQSLFPLVKRLENLINVNGNILNKWRQETFLIVLPCISF